MTRNPRRMLPRAEALRDATRSPRLRKLLGVYVHILKAEVRAQADLDRAAGRSRRAWLAYIDARGPRALSVFWRCGQGHEHASEGEAKACGAGEVATAP